MQGSASTAARVVALIGLVLGLAVAGCGGSRGSSDPLLGTVILKNDSNQGMAPYSVTAFFIQPAGTVDPGPNRLVQDLIPGGIVIVGQFEPGVYNASAILSTGGALPFLGLVVTPGGPTEVVAPVL